MSTVVTRPQKVYTAEEFLDLPNEEFYELVDGHLEERSMGAWSSFVGGVLFRLLSNYCQERLLGWVQGPECGYRCFPSRPNLVRKPDVSVIRRGRLPREEMPEGWITLAPDLAAEVISPRDRYYKVSAKIAEYLAAGVRLVWVINPADRTVLIYRADGSIAGVRETGDLDGEDVVPGFRCRVADLFRPTVPPAEG